MTNRRLKRGAGLALVGLLSIAAAGPLALAPTSGGRWEVAQSAKDVRGEARCIADPILLGQWEHRDAQCSRMILSDRGNKVVID